MGLGDRIRAWLRGEDGPGRPSVVPPASRSPRASSSLAARGRGRQARGRRSRGDAAFDASELLAFARSRRGVEVYLEPRTKLYGSSVLLVADDGEYLRRPVPDAATVRRVCDEHGIPVYDAARTGYPRRVRDYDRGVRPERVELDDLPPWPGADARGGTPVGVTDGPAADDPVDGGPRADTTGDPMEDDEDGPPPPPDV